MAIEITLLTAGHCTHPEAVSRRGATWRSVDFPALVAVIRHPDHGVILYDTGYSPRFFAATTRFPDSVYARAIPVSCTLEDTAAAQLTRAGIAPEEVRLIVVSHFHADHVGGARDFPNAQFVFLREALEPLRRTRGLGRLRAGFVPGLLPEDLDNRSTYVEDKPRVVGRSGALGNLGPRYDLLGDGTLVGVELPGHQCGHLGLQVRTGGPDLFLVGDACWSTRAFTHLELPHPAVRLVTHHWSAYRATITDLHRLSATSPDLLIVPSHCPEAIARARATLDAHR